MVRELPRLRLLVEDGLSISLGYAVRGHCQPCGLPAQNLPDNLVDAAKDAVMSILFRQARCELR